MEYILAGRDTVLIFGPGRPKQIKLVPWSTKLTYYPAPGIKPSNLQPEVIFVHYL